MGLMLGFIEWIDWPKLYRYQYTVAWIFLSRENKDTHSHIIWTDSNSIQGENWLKITAIHYYWRRTSLTERPRVSLSSNLLCTLVGMVYHQYAHTFKNLKPKLTFPDLARWVFFSNFCYIWLFGERSVSKSEASDFVFAYKSSENHFKQNRSRVSLNRDSGIGLMLAAPLYHQLTLLNLTLKIELWIADFGRVIPPWQFDKEAVILCLLNWMWKHVK